MASFNGNIGDNIHHNGFRSGFEEVFGRCKWTNLEIRRFYQIWADEEFNDEFAENANQYDVLVIGGGNFFEICHDYSNTGCTINLSHEVLEKIKVPILFNALGFDHHKGCTEKTRENFLHFIQSLLDRPQTLVSFRNDGSRQNFIDCYGKWDKRIFAVADGGFFADYLKTSWRKTYVPAESPVIGINLACDMQANRLKEKSYECFLDELRAVFCHLVDEQSVQLKFFPHIPSDLKIIHDLLARFEDKIARNHVEVAPLLSGQGQEHEIVNYYRNCDLITGMRFHTNVIGFGSNITSVPIVSYPKVMHLYLELDAAQWLADANAIDFVDSYYNLLNLGLRTDCDNTEQVSAMRRSQLATIREFKNRIKSL